MTILFQTAVLLATVSFAASQCFEWTEWGACRADCGEQGRHSRRRSCDYGGEFISKFEYDDCIGACTRPTTTTITASTTTPTPTPTPQPCTWSEWSPCDAPCGQEGERTKQESCPTTRGGEAVTHLKFEACTGEPCAPAPIEADTSTCSLSDWKKGRVHMPHPGNCHLYFVCERVHRNKFRMHGMDCGNLFWNQQALVCQERSPKPNVVGCKNVKNRPESPPQIATPSNCDNDNLVLQYDFESGFEDSCQSSSLIQRGDSDVTLVEEGGNTVACFDGSSFMEIPFLRSWFAGKKVKAFTVALWYNRPGPDTRPERGLVHNGGCLASDSGFHVTTGYGGVFGGVTTPNAYPLGQKQVFAITAPNSDWLEPAGWQHAVMTFDGVDVRFYLQGFERERAPSAGYLLHGDTDAFLGKLCENKFFNGCVDNLRIWNKVLTAAEVLRLQKN